MKKLLLLVVLLSSSVVLMAQKGKVSSASGYKESGNLTKAWSQISIATDTSNPKAEKSLAWAKTWVVKGDILIAMSESKDAAVKALQADPLLEALKCYNKAQELDPEKGLKTAVQSIMKLTSSLTNQGVTDYQAENYAGAANYFTQTLESVKLENTILGTAKVDTAIIFNAAISASRADMNDEAIALYQESMKHGYNIDTCLSELISIYEKMNQTDKAVEMMKTAVETSEKKEIKEYALIKLITYYMDNEQFDEAITFLDKAIENDPDNFKYILTKGSLFNQMGEYDTALVEFEKTIELNDACLEAYYNIGVIYYNRGVTEINKAYDIPPSEQAKFEAQKKIADELFAKSVPYLEKAFELDNSERAVLETLKNIYYRLEMLDKYNEADAKLKAL